MNARGHLIALAALLLPIEAAAQAATGPEDPSLPAVTLLRYDGAPDANPSSMVVEGREVGTYVLLLALAPGERLVKAEAEIHDGFFCRKRKRRKAARVLGAVGFDLLAGETPRPFRESLTLLRSLAIPAMPAGGPPLLRRRLALRARHVDIHPGYACVIVPIAAGPLSRVSFPKIVLESEGPDGRRRRRKLEVPSVLVPGGQTPGIDRDTLVRILTGRGPGPVEETDQEGASPGSLR